MGEQLTHQPLHRADLSLKFRVLAEQSIILFKEVCLRHVPDILFTHHRQRDRQICQNLRSSLPIHIVDNLIFAHALQVRQQVLICEAEQRNHIVRVFGKFALPRVDPLEHGAERGGCYLGVGDLNSVG